MIEWFQGKEKKSFFKKVKIGSREKKRGEMEKKSLYVVW